MSGTRPADTATRRAASGLKSLIAPVTIIGGSTLVSLVVSDAFLSVESYRRSFAAHFYGAINWFTGLDPLIVAGFVGVSALIAIVAIARRMA